MARRIVAAVIVLAILGVMGAILLRQHGQPSSSFAELSNRGTPAEFDLPVSLPGPTSALTGDALLIAEREDHRFYRLTHPRGLACLAVQRRHENVWYLGAVGCPPQFPSRAHPLMDFSSIEASMERPHPHFLLLAGIAADGVKRIAVIDADNRVVPAVDVVDNVYFTRSLPKGDFHGLAALDADDKVVWRDPPAP
jgi:hypothetical protein